MKNFGEAIKHYWVNYANFKGRTTKSTFWWAVLFLVLAEILINRIFPGTDGRVWTQFGSGFVVHENSTEQMLWRLATLIPNLAILVRRLRDTGRKGSWAWLLVVPYVGWGILIYWALKPSADANKAGNLTKR